MHAIAMRDSSLNQRTYWLRDGLYYSRASNLGDPAACELPADKLAQIPADDRQVLVEETSADPAFCRAVARVMATDPDWVHTIANSAKAAVNSELLPSKYPGNRTSWPKLRARVRALATETARAARTLADQLTPAERFALVKRIASGEFRVQKGIHGLGNLGQWDIIGSLVGAVAGAGASIYGGYVTADAQRDIAKLQANTAMQTAQAQMAIANANAAIANAQVQVSSPISSAISSMTSATVAGIPVVIPVLGAVALGLWLAFGRK